MVNGRLDVVKGASPFVPREARIGELEALVSGLRNQNEWLREMTGYQDNWLW